MSIERVFSVVQTYDTWIALGTGIVAVLILTASWRPKATLERTQPSVARWATTHDMRALRVACAPPDGILVGIRDGGWLAARPSASRRELRHQLVVGPTGSGKGLLAIAQLLSWRGSAIVSDPKGGELFRATAGWRSTFSHIVVLDPRGPSHCFDPLGQSQDEAEVYAAARSLMESDGDVANVFDQRAAGMVATMFTAAQREQTPAIPYVRHMVRLGIEGAAERLQAVDPALATLFLDRRFAEAEWSDKFLASCWGTLVARLRPMLTEDVARMLSTNTVEGRDLYGDKPTTIYLCWPETQLEALAPVVRLVWEALLREMVTWRDGHAAECRGRRVLALIDEAGRAPVPGLAEYATTVLSREITLWVGIQSRSQLLAKYGQASAQTLLDNMDTSVYYRPTDVATARFLEERTGSRLETSLSLSRGQAGAWTESRSERAVPLRATHETFTMDDNDALAFHSNLPPIRLERGDWREDEDLEARHGLATPAVPELPPLPGLPALGEAETTADAAPQPPGRLRQLAGDEV